MLRSRLRRANQPLVLAFGHTVEGEALSCDALLISPHTPTHDLELEDVASGQRYRVRAPDGAFDRREPQTRFSVTLEVLP